jgi:hypothetical protein
MPSHTDAPKAIWDPPDGAAIAPSLLTIPLPKGSWFTHGYGVKEIRRRLAEHEEILMVNNKAIPDAVRHPVRDVPDDVIA